ncbi:MAG: 4-hydroxy-tetrahydrodipicolinate reductase [Alphaproteobacteria bacterium]|nr:4-hydroxy-tetrahydrodipicolinate reductase [Alphaproteobacteria bacterium]
MKISVLGATGSMGGLIIKSALREGCKVSNKVSSKDKISDLFLNTDAIVDFSCPVATELMLNHVVTSKVLVPMVIGTTGLSGKCMNLMEHCSNFVQLFYSPNMSFMISIVNMMLYATSKILEGSYDVEIFEAHHRLKKDAPSGTAIMFGRTIAQARGDRFEDVARFTRYGVCPLRQDKEIGFSVQRCGSVAGKHEVSFVGKYETLKIKHTAHSKEIFAKGAVKAAKWLVQQKPGFYTMNDFTRDSVIPMVRSLYKDFFSKV